MSEQREGSEHEFGKYGGRYVPEDLEEALDRLAEAFDTVVETDAFQERNVSTPFSATTRVVRHPSTTQRTSRASTAPRYISSAKTYSAERTR